MKLVGRLSWIAAAILALIVAMPGLVGIMIQDRLKSSINSSFNQFIAKGRALDVIPKDKSLKLITTTVSRGWFTTKLALTLRNKSIKGEKNITWHVKIKHGPIWKANAVDGSTSIHFGHYGASIIRWPAELQEVLAQVLSVNLAQNLDNSGQVNIQFYSKDAVVKEANMQIKYHVSDRWDYGYAIEVPSVIVANEGLNITNIKLHGSLFNHESDPALIELNQTVSIDDVASPLYNIKGFSLQSSLSSQEKSGTSLPNLFRDLDIRDISSIGPLMDTVKDLKIQLKTDDVELHGSLFDYAPTSMYNIKGLSIQSRISREQKSGGSFLDLDVGSIGSPMASMTGLKIKLKTADKDDPKVDSLKIAIGDIYLPSISEHSQHQLAIAWHGYADTTMTSDTQEKSFKRLYGSEIIDYLREIGEKGLSKEQFNKFMPELSKMIRQLKDNKLTLTYQGSTNKLSVNIDSKVILPEIKIIKTQTNGQRHSWCYTDSAMSGIFKMQSYASLESCLANAATMQDTEKWQALCYGNRDSYPKNHTIKSDITPPYCIQETSSQNTWREFVNFLQSKMMEKTRAQITASYKKTCLPGESKICDGLDMLLNISPMGEMFIPDPADSSRYKMKIKYDKILYINDKPMNNFQ
jgi:hypothetical protein